MRQFFSDRWLTMLLLLATIGVLICTVADVRNLLTAVNKMYISDQVIIPTQLPPTVTPLPATPTGPFPLTNDSGKNTLISNKGVPVYELNANEKWVPLVPNLVSASLPDNSELMFRDESWILTDEMGNTLYRWNSTLMHWVKARITPSTPTENENQTDHYSVLNDQFNLDELISKTDDELLEMAPQLSPEVYGIESDILSPNSVLRIGEGENIPYLLYTDQNGQVKMGWNIQSGEVEHVEDSIYRDPKTGFLVHALVITDNSTVRDGKRWYSLRELSRGDLANAIFDYTLPINYFYRNYSEAFREMLGVRYSSVGELFLNELSANQVNNLLSESRNVFEEDIKNLTNEERAIIRIGNSNKIQVNSEAYFLFRITLGSRYKMQGGGSSHNVTIIPQAWFESAHLNAVGGLLVKVLREITIGGDQSYVDLFGHHKGVRSTTGQMVIDLCGEEVINDYLNRLGGEFQEKKIIPITDSSTSILPLCLLEENRVP